MDSQPDRDRGTVLRDIRDKLITELEAAEGPHAAVVAKELRATLSELESLAPRKEGSRFDELAARREARLAGAEGQLGPAGQ